MKRSCIGNVGVCIAAVLAVSVSASSCFRHVVQSRQLPTTAFLRLGQFQRGDVVTAAGEQQYRFILDGSSDTLYEVEQGRYDIQVISGDAVMARRTVYVAAGETKEITP